MGIFRDKIAIVTGGASGIGRGLVEELARRGATVIIVDVQIETAREVAQGINESGGAAKAVDLDVTDYEGIRALVEETAAEYGRLDYMFNNAGVAFIAEARDMTYQDWKRVIDVNLYGVLNGTIAAYDLMVKHGFGHIVNTASLAGLLPGPPCWSSYVTSKHGVVGLSKVLRLEGADLGVKVSVLCPEADTPIFHSPTRKLDLDKFIENLPKLSSTDECALAILKGVERNKAVIIVSAWQKIGYIFYRMFPGPSHWGAGKMVKWIRRNLRVEEDSQ
jgi:NAD(P)-dependent dehydrogenase (short-subunit alcohol dehydrogenase family)